MTRTALYIILILNLISCQSPTDLKLDVNSAKEYSDLNNYLLKSQKKYGLVKKSETLTDLKAQNSFDILKSNNKLIYLSYSEKDLIFYKIKQEKVNPFLGLGLQYFSHYLVYTEYESPNFKKIFKNDFELEEFFFQCNKITNKWYYVIGEHYSD